MKLKKTSTMKDIEKIEVFFSQIFEDVSFENLDCFIRSITGQHCFNKLEYYLGYKNTDIVGISGIYADNNDECWLGWFGIRPEYRRKGYATTILEMQLKMMKDYGYKICRLYTDEIINKNAINLYIKKGFYKDSIYKKNVITMSKSLDNMTVPSVWIGKPLGFD